MDTPEPRVIRTTDRSARQLWENRSTKRHGVALAATDFTPAQGSDAVAEPDLTSGAVRS